MPDYRRYRVPFRAELIFLLSICWKDMPMIFWYAILTPSFVQSFRTVGRFRASKPPINAQRRHQPVEVAVDCLAANSPYRITPTYSVTLFSLKVCLP